MGMGRYKMELQQPPMEKGMSIQELVAKHMNEGKNMVEISFEGQHKSLPSILEVIREEKKRRLALQRRCHLKKQG